MWKELADSCAVSNERGFFWAFSRLGRQILRDLARRVAEIAAEPVQVARRDDLHARQAACACSCSNQPERFDRWVRIAQQLTQEC